MSLKSEPLLSIIIPIYNVEPYIEKCIKSILKQNLDLVEVLLINDGTLDSSFEIAKTITSGNPRFIFLEKENGGLSSARNFGLKYATGKYIYFIDSDDYIEPNSLDKILESLQTQDLDCLVFDYERVSENGEKEFTIKDYTETNISTGVEFMAKFNIHAAVWTYVFKRSILEKHNLKFLNGIYHEDELFTPILFFYMDRMKYVDIKVYNYLQRPNSIMNSADSFKREKSIRDIVTIIKELNLFVDSITIYRDKTGIVKKIEFLLISCILRLRFEEKEKRNIFFSHIKIYLKRYSFNESSIKMRIYIKVCCLFNRIIYPKKSLLVKFFI